MKKTQIDDLPSSLNRTLIVGWMRVRLHCHRSISPICCCPHLDVWLPFSNASDCRGKFAVYHDTKSHTAVDQWHRLSHNVTSPGYPLWHSAPFRPLARFVELRGMQRRKKIDELHGKKLVRFLWYEPVEKRSKVKNLLSSMWLVSQHLVNGMCTVHPSFFFVIHSPR